MKKLMILFLGIAIVTTSWSPIKAQRQASTATAIDALAILDPARSRCLLTLVDRELAGMNAKVIDADYVTEVLRTGADSLRDEVSTCLSDSDYRRVLNLDDPRDLAVVMDADLVSRALRRADLSTVPAEFGTDAPKVLATDMCVAQQILSTLGAHRTDELGLTIATPNLDPTQLDAREKNALVDAMLECGQVRGRLEQLFSTVEPQLAVCILDRLDRQNQISDFLTGMANEVPFDELSLFTGYRYSCSQAAMDLLGLDILGDAAGEEVQHVAQDLLDLIVGPVDLNQYESICTIRKIGGNIQDDFIPAFRAQKGTYLHDVEAFLASQDPSVSASVTASVVINFIDCADPYKLLGNTLQAAGIPKDLVYCMRAITDTKTLGEAFRSSVIIDSDGRPVTGSSLTAAFDYIGSALSRCGTAAEIATWNSFAIAPPRNA